MPESIITAALPLVLACTVVFALWARHLERKLHALGRPLHELRGAMSALGLGLALVERETSFRRHGARLDALRAQLGRASAAIDELDRHRGASRAKDYDEPTQVLDLASLVRQRARAWSQLAPAYRARLRLSWCAGPVTLHGDRSRLEQAIDNLIANALEHGGGQVVVEGARCGGTLRISIWDSGTGLPGFLDELPDAPVCSKRGHGLAIARAAIEWHGGRLSSARRDGGTAIDVALPIEPVEESRALPPRGVRPDRRTGSTAAHPA